MLHSLTDKQLKNLRWIVEKIKDGKLKESFAVVNMADGRPHFYSKYIDDVPEYVDLGSMYALALENIIHGEKGSNNTYHFTVRQMAYEIEAFDYFNPDPDPLTDYMVSCHLILESRLKNSELNSICFHMGVNHERVFHPNDLDWPSQLLLFLYRRRRLTDLEETIKNLRPDITDWPPYPEDLH